MKSPSFSCVAHRQVWARLTLTMLLCLPPAATAVAEPLKVVASIRPLALMVEEIAGDHVEISVLVRPGQTPHDFAFRVSDRQRLERADLLVWVGPALEPYLAGLVKGREQLAMVSVVGEAELDQHRGHGDHDDDHDHDHSHADQHFWLHPVYGKAMVAAIGETLARLDPSHSADYRRNAQRIGEQLLGIAPPAAHALPARSERQYAVVHQAFDYFLDYFPYSRPMVLTPIPEASPGARQLWLAGQRLQRGDCVLVESRSPGKWVQTFAERNDLRIKLVDIMGYEEKVNTYTQLLEDVRNAFDDCAR